MMEEASSKVFLLLSILKLGAMVVRSCVDWGCVVSNGGRGAEFGRDDRDCIYNERRGICRLAWIHLSFRNVWCLQV